MEVSDKPVLVTGAAGYLASRLVRKLLQAGVHVRGLVRTGSSAVKLRREIPAALHDRLELVIGNLLRSDDCRRAAEGCGVVYHVAAQLTGGVAPLMMNNVVGTQRLIAAAADEGAVRLVLVSSIAVYDTQKLWRRGVVDEALPLDQQPHLRDPYTYSKVEQELAAQTACRERNIPLTVVRPGVIYGPGRECFSGRVGLRLGRLVLMVGGGHALPYTHVENCAEAIRLAGSAPGVEGEAFNVVDDATPTGKQILRAYRAAGKKLRTIRLPFFLMKRLGAWNAWYHRWSEGQLPAVVTPYKVEAMWKTLQYSNRRAKEQLSWRPVVGWRDTISECFPAS